MKVLHIINSLTTGGAEKLLLDSLPIYQKYEVEADVLLLNSNKTPFYNEFTMNFNGNILTSKYSSIYNPLQIFQIHKYSKDYDLINVHLFPSLYWAAISKLIFRHGVPLVFTEHSTWNKRIDNYFFSKVDRIIYYAYQKIIAITPQVKEKLISNLHIDENKIEVIYNGVNIQTYFQSIALNVRQFFPNNIPIKVLIQVSNFHEAKDQKTVINALTQLPPHYCLLLVGEGKLKAECEFLVKELKLNDRVLFLGNRMDVPKLLKASDIVIQSSHWEGFGLAAVEGMAAGKPVIASDVSGLSEIVKGSGLTFEEGDFKDLAKKILLLEDKTYYQHITNLCIEKSKKFDVQNMIKLYINLYHEISKNANKKRCFCNLFDFF